MTTKIEYIFINEEVHEVDADDDLAAIILLEKTHEESGERKQERIKKKLLSLAKEEWFASQWGNPEADILSQEARQLLTEASETLTGIQRRRLGLRILGLSYSDIARMEDVSVQTVKDSIGLACKKLMVYMEYKTDE